MKKKDLIKEIDELRLKVMGLESRIGELQQGYTYDSEEPIVLHYPYLVNYKKITYDDLFSLILDYLNLKVAETPKPQQLKYKLVTKEEKNV